MTDARDKTLPMAETFVRDYNRGEWAEVRNERIIHVCARMLNRLKEQKFEDALMRQRCKSALADVEDIQNNIYARRRHS